MNATAERVRLAANALSELFREYPTDADSTTGAVLLTITDTASAERHCIELQPGQTDWLRQLAEAEASTARASHPDQRGLCGHCNGTGRASANRCYATRFTERVIALAAEADLHPTRSQSYRGAWRVYLDAKAGPQSLCGSITVGARSGRILRAQLIHDGGAKISNHTGAVEARQALAAYANSIGHGLRR
ncbi:hypothetical protein ACFVZ3_09040 [Kitasatospora purpeofusca]|uniref:hypothetical protein n=1 Tax=Kitasatospora purpeofusca TaxID=67352 RepID=UPI0036CF8BB7